MRSLDLLLGVRKYQVLVGSIQFHYRVVQFTIGRARSYD